MKRVDKTEDKFVHGLFLRLKETKEAEKMKRLYVLRRNERGFLTFMASVISLTAMTGFILGLNFPKGSARTVEDMQVNALEVRVYIEDAIREGETSVEAIKKVATKIGKKNGLDVFYPETFDDKLLKVNICINLSNKYAKILSFNVNL